VWFRRLAQLKKQNAKRQTRNAKRFSRRIFRRLDYVAKGREELVGYGSVDDPVIEAQGQQSYLPDGDCVVDHNRPFLNHPNPKYRDLRLIDYRRSDQPAKYAGIGDREGPPLHIIGLELLSPGTFAKIINGPRQAKQRFLVGIAYNRNYESPVECDGHADVDLLFVDDLIAPNRGVDGPFLIPSILPSL
jgi:hypothetical protein